MSKETPKQRLEYLRGELRAERISQGELCELQMLVPYIELGDVELLEAAGVPEFTDPPEGEQKDMKYPPLTAFRITFDDGSVIATNMAAGITLAEATAYYVGQRFVNQDEVTFRTGVKVEQIH
jgi:hypothetical protein